MSQDDFKPSDVVLDAIPLVATMGRLEREAAATIMVRALVRGSDTFQAITPHDIGVAMKKDLEEHAMPLEGLRTNPFWRPDFRDLVAHGYAQFHGDPDVKNTPISFTEKGVEALRKYRRTDAAVAG